MTWLENVILSVVEGVTEFLPVSSTGHLMLTREWLGMKSDENSTFIIAIQFGAILSVLSIYWKRLIGPEAKHLIPILFVGFIPAAIFGLLFDDLLDKLLQAPWIAGVNLVIFGVVLLFIEKIFPQGEKEIRDLTIKDAFWVGMFQCLAILLPGVSRSASGIAGGLHTKLSRKAATEFTFLLALPTLSAAAGYKLLKDIDNLNSQQLIEIGWGSLFSFITALIAVKFFVGYVQKFGFKVFGYYRIAIGSIFLIWYYC
jgi:undecaprenyl-diphosphatase